VDLAFAFVRSFIQQQPAGEAFLRVLTMCCLWSWLCCVDHLHLLRAFVRTAYSDSMQQLHAISSLRICCMQQPHAAMQNYKQGVWQASRGLNRSRCPKNDL
jgi:REP element-mobilizing transposase RayT